jgi:hypothetical protein
MHEEVVGSDRSMRMLPVTFVWQPVEVIDQDGVAARRMAMVPLARYGNVAGRQFHEGEEYPLVVLEARSRSSHNHYFAAVGEAFQNLPENIAARWPTAEHLRKWVLIETGWFEEKEFEMPDQKSAYRLGKFIRTENDHARISIHAIGGGVHKVIVRVAKSQSAAAMPKQTFEDSKRDVLDYLASMIDVKRSDLNKAARRSA